MSKKVAIHKTPSITKSGRYCSNYPDNIVVIGSNPVGPRGGHGGKWASGRVVARYSYGKWDDAIEHVRKLISDGYTQI